MKSANNGTVRRRGQVLRDKLANLFVETQAQREPEDRFTGLTERERDAFRAYRLERRDYLQAKADRDHAMEWRTWMA